MNKPYVVPTSVSDQVDDYLRFKAEAAALDAKIDALKPVLTALGVVELTGTQGTITIDSVNGRKTTDWKSLAARYKIPQVAIDDATKVGDPSYRISIKYTKL